MFFCPPLQGVTVASRGAVVGEWTADWDAAISLAKENNSCYIIVVANSSGCEYCAAADNNTFNKTEFKSWSKTNNIPLVYADGYYGVNKEPIKSVLSRWSDIVYAPTVLIVDSVGDGKQRVAKFNYRSGVKVNGLRIDLTPTRFIQIYNSFPETEREFEFQADAWDASVLNVDGDESSVYATLLNFDVASSQYHTLSGEDTADWFVIPDLLAEQIYYLEADVTQSAALLLNIYTNGVDGIVGEYYSSDNLSDYERGIYFTPKSSSERYFKISKSGEDSSNAEYTLRWHKASTELHSLIIMGENTRSEQFLAEGVISTIALTNTPPVAKIFDRWQVTPESAYLGSDFDITSPMTSIVMPSNTVTLTAKYVDYMSGRTTSLRVSNKIQEMSQVLSANDAVDWYSISLKAGTYLTLSIASDQGNSIIQLYDEDNTVVAGGLYTRSLCDQSGTYYIAIIHGDGNNPVDSSYVLSYQSHLVGTVEMDKDSYNVKEGSEYAELSVERSSKEGHIRVRYWSEAISATPGVDYKPVQGELEWLNGDGKDKDILVPLIPDLRSNWDTDKMFKVYIELLSEDELEVNEFIPALAETAMTEVIITESERVDPGEIEFIGYSVEGSDEILSFENTRKPAVVVNAGDSITLWAGRIEGSDGVVSVQLSTDDDDATAGSDYESIDSQTLTWASGDSSPQPVTIFTEIQEVSYLSIRSFDVEMSLDRDTSGGVKLGADSVTVELRDIEVATTADEWEEALDDADSGLGVKVRDSECWFIDKDGNFRSIPIDAGDSTDFRVSVEGPGIFRFSASLLTDTQDDSSLTYTIGRDDPINCEDGEIVELYIEEGKESVEFELDRPRGSSENAEVYAIFNVISGVLFEWTPLECVTDCLPVDDALVLPGYADVSWNSDHEQGFRLTLADSKSNLTRAPLFTIYILESEYCIGCAVGDPVLEAGARYYWQVNTVIPGADTSDSTLDILVSQGPVMTFTIGEAGDFSTQELVEPLLAEFVNTTGDGYRLVQGLYTKIGPFITDLDDDVEIDYDDSDLPKGLKLTTIRGDGTYIVGVPSTVDSYATEITATQSVGREKYNGTTFAFNFDVEAAGLAAGEFCGVINSQWSDQNKSMAFIEFDASEKGKISAKAIIAGTSYRFRGTGYSEEVISEDSDKTALRVNLSQIVKFNRIEYTNNLIVTVCRGEWSEESILSGDNYCELSLWQENEEHEIVEELFYDGNLIRDISDIPELSEALDPYVGYYTISIPPTYATDGKPQGSGYITMTIDSRGRLKVAGLLADGSKLSASSIPGCLWSLDDNSSSLMVPIYTAKKTVALGGWIIIERDLVSGIPFARGVLSWFNADPESTRGGLKGFGLDLMPEGGFYDELINLQTYYLNYDLSFSGAYNLPQSLDDEYTELLCYPEDGAIALNIIDDDFEVEDSELVKDENDRSLVKLADSINPCDLTIRFKHSTGIYSGSFSLWYSNSDGSSQEEERGIKYYGVMTPQKADYSWHLNCPGQGFYLMPEQIDKRKWTGSYLFEIQSTFVDRDWSER